MATFDIIEDANIYESIAGRQSDDEIIYSVPEPIVIRGVGHLTLYVRQLWCCFSFQLMTLSLLRVSYPSLETYYLVITVYIFYMIPM